MHKNIITVSIGQIIAEIWPFVDLLRWRPFAILNYQKFDILTTIMLKWSHLHQHAKFGADQSYFC